MVVNVKPEQLSEAIRGQLEEYSADVTKAINQNLKEVARQDGRRAEKRRIIQRKDGEIYARLECIGAESVVSSAKRKLFRPQ